MTFADKLKELRAAKELSQAGLASLCNVSMDTIRAYEQGLRSPSAEVLFSLASALGADCRDFQKCTFTMKKQSPEIKKKAKAR